MFTHAQPRKQATAHYTRPTRRRRNSKAQVETQPLSMPTGTQARGLHGDACADKLTYDGMLPESWLEERDKSTS